MAYNITLTGLETQNIVEILAALELGNSKLKSTSAAHARLIFEQPLNDDKRHYLFLHDADDLASWSGCGSAHGAVDHIVEDKALITRLYAIPETECPNCGPEKES